MKHILILGRSKKFLTVIEAVFPKAQITIIPWRDLQNFKDILRLQKRPPIDLILIAGYDFKSYWYSYNEYIKVNIERPLSVIEYLRKSNPLIIYINTANGDNKKTYSRYRFAKTELAIQLLKRCKNVRIVSPPLLVDQDKKPDVRSGILSSTIFHILIYFELVTYLTPADLISLILKTIQKSAQPSPMRLIPYGLKIRRNQFLDRCLRMIVG
jgi:hypothetical protein